ncbi:TPA: hypothetical protein DIC20_05150 [Candidatus Dependentiae bacterium]|nr:MAG: hypothetical protein US03_C0010G0002 [candidate division TM6 bacterium GW2011_GWF2_36_131]KKQ02505.1 MAG: hypothetical protein US13_C0016G0012 [candidate division TM6 bacterium GW2011_GWE2_36_25]KKQ18802.1 MAG: hypothetical protein US32_C0022G0007 [candidate division TM6 bacterium GW2011_GWA2_36_9]HBR70160.1 hypothetical protein [Candidatus Dependentiae bacterium]HCU01058.1 hypothetical protein [Candidatus Dependentiae bacterium]
MKYKFFKIKILIISLTITTPSHAMYEKHKSFIRKSLHSTISQNEARENFPRDLPMEAQLQFLKLFLYRITPIENRKQMVRVFSEVNGVSYSHVLQFLKSQIPSTHTKRKKHQLAPDERILESECNVILHQIAKDQRRHRRFIHIFNETMKAISSSKIGPTESSPVAEEIPFEPAALESFIDKNPFEPLRELIEN